MPDCFQCHLDYYEWTEPGVVSSLVSPELVALEYPQRVNRAPSQTREGVAVDMAGLPLLSSPPHPRVQVR